MEGSTWSLSVDMEPGQVVLPTSWALHPLWDHNCPALPFGFFIRKQSVALP